MLIFFYFMCSFSFLLTPRMPPIAPVTIVIINLNKVAIETASVFFIRPNIVIKMNITKPVSIPTKRPADFVILAAIKPPNIAPAPSTASITYLVRSAGKSPIERIITAQIHISITESSNPHTEPKNIDLKSSFLSDIKIPPNIICLIIFGDI